jgi:KaiC/GvpD/RAD55 family RecA-like ATPase
MENVKDSSEVEAKNVKSGFSSGFATHDFNDSGMKAGDLILLTGSRNQGKTTFSRQIVISAAQQGIKSLVWYAEADEGLEKGYLVRLVANSDEVEKYDNGFGRTTWLANEDAQKRFNEEYENLISMYVKPVALEVPVFTDLMTRMRDSAKHGTRLFVIDNMMKLTADQANALDAQKRIIMELKDFAVRTDSTIILICHPRKGDGDQSISGALEQENTADTILRFSRKSAPKTPDAFPPHERTSITAMVSCEKIRNGGTMHPMFFEFSQERQANIEITYLPEIKWAVSATFSRPPKPSITNDTKGNQ